ncbi:ABC transporter permease [Microlunatus elymi]|uniref:ABC transporter permease n=1 Tax=Microlunatus elymi TaxID=2596828 RepID=A0A516PUA4_9ACTN|nr:ABC transporter permease [Microlunatus elymi]QDP94757.1 ABC transporter permease [Microlunatus elymi]
MWEFIKKQPEQLLYNSYQHASLVIQAVIIATVIAVALAILILRVPRLTGIANAVSAIGLTIPSFALLGLLIPLIGIGWQPALVAVVFYAVLPILRNAVVGLQGVEPVLVESARGMGMNPIRTLLRVELPLAWPVILAGIRISMQMSFGIAAIAAYVLGPGLGTYIFGGLSNIGGAGATASALTGTIGVVIIALIVDGLLVLLARATTSRGIRV